MKSYLITDPDFFTSTPKVFKEKLEIIFKSRKKPDFVCFRDKKSINFKELAEVFIKTSRNFNIEKILINTDFELASMLGADGVHLNSLQFKNIEKAKSLNLYTIISTHNFEDIKNAKELGADAVTFSPIFYSPNKGEPQGLETLKEMTSKFDIKIFALGGIVSGEQIKMCQNCGSFGFASIRYFAT